jgi:hypothetical protein
MDQQQQELRRAAAKAFMDSLNKLQATLSDADELSETVTETVEIPVPEEKSEVMDQWEEAVADIERFMQEQNEDAAEKSS